jgi:hypothetical protein
MFGTYMVVLCGAVLLLLPLTIGIGAWRLLRTRAFTPRQFWTITVTAALLFIGVPLVVLVFVLVAG